MQKDHHEGVRGNLHIEPRLPTTKVVEIHPRITIVGIELCEDTLIVSCGIVPSRGNKHDTLMNRLMDRLGDWSLFKDRVTEKAEVIHDHLRASRSKLPHRGNEIQTGGRAGPEEQAGPWCQVIDDFCHGPALIRDARNSAALLAIDNEQIGWQVTTIDRRGHIGQAVRDDSHPHPLAGHAKIGPHQIGPHHGIPFGGHTARTAHTIRRWPNPVHKGQSRNGCQGIKSDRGIDHVKLRITLQHMDAMLPQCGEGGWGECGGRDVDFTALGASDTQHRLQLRARRSHTVLGHHLRGGAYRRGNAPLRVRDSGLERVELTGEILTGAGGRQATPQQEPEQQAAALPRAAPTECFHVLLLSRDHGPLPDAARRAPAGVAGRTQGADAG